MTSRYWIPRLPGYIRLGVEEWGGRLVPALAYAHEMYFVLATRDIVKCEPGQRFRRIHTSTLCGKQVHPNEVYVGLIWKEISTDNSQAIWRTNEQQLQRFLKQSFDINSCSVLGGK